MSSITTITHLPQEVLYMILDYLPTKAERASCRLICKHFMSVGSYIFKQVRFTTREQVKFFSTSLSKNTCIANYVQIIYVDTAALLRALNQTNVKQICHNVKEIQILFKQGRGTWAQHLAQYPKVQHPPTLLDAKNAKMVMDRYQNQMTTLRLGGIYVNKMNREEIATMVQQIPNLTTFGLHYLFKEKNKDIHKDLPKSWTFEDFNFLLGQTNKLRRFELNYCEIADQSLIAADTNNTELIQQLRRNRTAPMLLEASLLNNNPFLKEIDMKNVQVSNVTHFIRSILDSYENLESLDLSFVNKYMVLEICVGDLWDVPHPDAWERNLLGCSRLKKLALRHPQSRLQTNKLLTALGRARAPLTDITIIDSGDRENDSMVVICDQFARTLISLTMDCKAHFGLEGIGTLTRLQTASLRWSHNLFERLACPAEILESVPTVTDLTIGYNKWFSGMISRAPNFSYQVYTNLISITLERIIMNENEMKELLLPLVNLREAVFVKCMFETSKPIEDDDEDQGHRSSDEDNALDREEVFNFMPSSGELEDNVRNVLFVKADKQQAREKTTAAAAAIIIANEFDGSLGVDTAFPADAEPGANAVTSASPTRPRQVSRKINNRPRSVIDLSTSKRNNLDIRSLSLEHFGLHDCRLRERQGDMHNARTIRNFEIIHDVRSGCELTYDIDRAFHEKKVCNPHVVLNKTVKTDATVTYHYTHDFGGNTQNDYMNSRPTFKIRLFSLDKLSIRPNCSMSIYFTGRYGEKLKTCKQVLKEQIQLAKLNTSYVEDILATADVEPMEEQASSDSNALANSFEAMSPYDTLTSQNDDMCVTSGKRSAPRLLCPLTAPATVDKGKLPADVPNPDSLSLDESLNWSGFPTIRPNVPGQMSGLSEAGPSNSFTSITLSTFSNNNSFSVPNTTDTIEEDNSDIEEVISTVSNDIPSNDIPPPQEDDMPIVNVGDMSSVDVDSPLVIYEDEKMKNPPCTRAKPNAEVGMINDFLNQVMARDIITVEDGEDVVFTSDTFEEEFKRLIHTVGTVARPSTSSSEVVPPKKNKKIMAIKPF